MFRHVRGNGGIALIMALILSLIALALGSAVIWMVTQSTEVSGMSRRYDTALAAAKGGAMLATTVIDDVGKDPDGAETFSQIPCPTRIDYKIKNVTAEWGAAPACAQTYDMKINALGPANEQFQVYMTIIDTIGGNIAPTGNPNLRVTGVVNTGAVIKNPSVFPYMYRVDVYSERPNPMDPANPADPYDATRTPLDVSNVTMLYAR